MTNNISIASDRMLSISDKLKDAERHLLKCAERPDDVRAARNAELILKDLCFTTLDSLMEIVRLIETARE